MTICIKHSLVTVLAVLGSLGARGDSTDPAPLFHLDFDHGFNAIAKGSGEPTNTGNLPTLVDGIRGKAALFKQGRVLRYLESNNLDKQRGSISMWVQACIAGNGEQMTSANGRYTLFREDSPDTAGENALRLWIHGGRGLRFDMRNASQSSLLAPEASEDWKKGEWHHVVATWDVDCGSQIYVDGYLACSREVPRWDIINNDGFLIGAFNVKGIQAWDAAIDEVVIYDRALTAEQVREEYARIGKNFTVIKPVDPFLSAGVRDTVKISVRNYDVKATPFNGLHIGIAGAEGRTAASVSLNDVVIESGSCAVLKAPVTLDEPGVYQLTLDYTENGMPMVYHEDITVLPRKEEARAGAPKQTLVAEVDAAKQEPVAQCGKSKVVASPLGNYREGGETRENRFLMKFDVGDVDAPHRAVITYPDDKPRTMEVILQDLSGVQDYQAQTGVFTGDEYALSQKMREHSFIFYPHSAKQSMIFMTAEEGHPAAVKDIKIYRLDHLPAFALSGVFKGSVPARNIGFYYEDAVLNQNFGQPTGMDGFAKSTDRLLDYMQSFGQNVLCYPVAWYHGPLYGTLVEPYQPDVGGSIGGYRPHPRGFPAYFLKRLGARGMKFNAGLHIHWLPSLDPYANTDIGRVAAGEDTVANVRGDGKIWWGHWHGADPNYNPTDPRVMRAVKAVVDEIGERYGNEPAFEGVTFVMARPKLFQFGSIESGYNDVNLRGFQTETGIKIPPYEGGNANRFSASYRWLMENPGAKKAWIDWRCRKLHDHYKNIADALSACRADLKVTLNYFLPIAFEGRAADYLSSPDVEILKEAGIDPALYAKDSNIVMSYTLVPSEYRLQRARGEKSPMVEARRTAMLAPEVVDSFVQLPRDGVILHDRYWENAVGKKNPLVGISGDPAGRECPWRVSTLNGCGENSLETYVAALNNVDALEITKGGYLIGTFGMEKELRAFSAAFRALPAVKFEDVKGMEDPVRVRQKIVDGQLYFYTLNRLPEPVSIKIALTEKATVEEPASGEVTKNADQMTVELAPFGLRTFRVPVATNMIAGGQPVVSRIWIDRLGQDLERVREKVKAGSPSDKSKASPYLAMAEQCWKDKHYARLHFLLQESWAK